MGLVGLATVSPDRPAYVCWTCCTNKCRSADRANLCHPPCMASSTAQQSLHKCGSHQNSHVHHGTHEVTLVPEPLVQTIVPCGPKTAPNYFPTPNNWHIGYKPSANTSSTLGCLPEHPEVTQGSLAITWHYSTWQAQHAPMTTFAYASHQRQVLVPHWQVGCPT